MDGIFTKLNAKREMVDGRTTVTKVTPSTLHPPPSTLNPEPWRIDTGREQVNPDFLSSSVATGTTLTSLVTIEVDDAIALCGMEFFQLANNE